jgi:hypothetical protein
MFQPPASPTLGVADFITLACVRDQVAGLTDELADAAQAIRHWDRLIEAWERQGLLSLIAFRLDRHGVLARLPPQPAANIRRIDGEYAKMSRIYAEQAVEFVHALLDVGIRCCVLKDPRGYPTSHTRPNYDLDLLVHPSDAESARRRLATLGLRAEHAPHRSGFVNKAIGMERVHNGLKIVVDLHWNILGGYMPRAALIDVEGLLERTTTVPMMGSEIPVLSLVDHIINTSVHNATHEHRWSSRLIRYLDTAEAVRAHSGEVDWAGVVGTATRWRALTDTHFSLGVAKTVLGAPVPADVLQAVRPDCAALGLESSAFGYLTYLWKSVDNVIGSYGAKDGSYVLAYADTLLPAAQQGAETVLAVTERVAELSGGPVTTFGEAGALIADPTLPVLGRVDATTAPVSWSRVSADLIGMGFVKTPDGFLARKLSHVEVRVSQPPAGGHASRLNPVITTAVYLRRAWARRRAVNPPVLDFSLVPGTSAEQLDYILSRYRDLQAIDPPGIAYVAEVVDQLTPAEMARAHRAASRTGRITLELVLACRAEAGIGSWAWGQDDSPTVLDALDRRTATLEELTRFLWTPAGASLALLLGAESRLKAAMRIVASLLCTPASLVSQCRTFRMALTKAGTTRQVPPRMYLDPRADSLIGLFGAYEPSAK